MRDAISTLVVSELRETVGLSACVAELRMCGAPTYLMSEYLLRVEETYRRSVFFNKKEQLGEKAT